MKRKLSVLAIVLLVIVSILTIPASADVGPNPSVEIRFRGLNDSAEYYVTLLSQRGTGPAQLIAPEDLPTYLRSHSNWIPQDEWDGILKLAAYQDPDGYGFLDTGWELRQGMGSYLWGYRPPAEFKILVYFPESDSYAVSDAKRQFSFNTIYTVDFSEVTLTPGQVSPITAELIPAFGGILAGVALRCVLTILIELLVALCFGLLRRCYLPVIIGVNVCTQVLLHVVLGMYLYSTGGGFMYFVLYGCMEVFVAVAEMILYLALIPRCMPSGRLKERTGLRFLWLAAYTLVANIVSFLAGAYLSFITA